MHVIFVEPRFPPNQRQFVRGLKAAGATVRMDATKSGSTVPKEAKPSATPNNAPSQRLTLMLYFRSARICFSSVVKGSM